MFWVKINDNLEFELEGGILNHIDKDTYTLEYPSGNTIQFSKVSRAGMFINFTRGISPMTNIQVINLNIKYSPDQNS